MALADTLHHSTKANFLVAACVTLSIAIVGYAVTSSWASGSFASLEAEKAVLSGGSLKTGDDNNASGGKYIVFSAAAAPTDLHNTQKKDIAMQLVSAAENSSLDWKAQYAYIEYNVEGNEAENRGYTAGIIGFTTKTGDLLDLVRYYKQLSPGNVLEKYIPALEKVNGSSSTAGLGTTFANDWKAAASAADGKFRQAQDYERDRVYFNPAVNLAKQDGLRTLGQFAYYDAAVMHGPDDWGGGLLNIRAKALKKAKTPAQGGDEKTYLNAFLDERKAEMLREAGHSDTTRVDTAQRMFLQAGNLDLNTPLTFSVYGDRFTIN